MEYFLKYTIYVVTIVCVSVCVCVYTRLRACMWGEKERKLANKRKAKGRYLGETHKIALRGLRNTNSLYGSVKIFNVGSLESFPLKRFQK